MHPEALASETRRVPTLLCEMALAREFCLGGGTGLALHMGHRLSVDLDWSCRAPFDPMLLRAEFPAESKVIVTGTAANTLHATVDEVKVDFLRYDYPLLEQPQLWEGVSVLSVRDITAMKLSAVANRGAKKDFYDIAWLLRSHSLQELLGWYEQKFQGFDTFSVIRSLTWFDDAQGTRSGRAAAARMGRGAESGRRGGGKPVTIHWNTPCMNLTSSSYRRLFWDTDVAALDADRHAALVLSRILERGSWAQWVEARNYYGRERMIAALTQTRGLEPRSVSFCSLVLGTPREAFASAGRYEIAGRKRASIPP
jgi:hypothetical protein